MEMVDYEIEVSADDISRLADMIMTLQRSFMIHLSDQLSAGQVSFPQFFLLCHIHSHDMLSMSEIAAKMDHTTAAATGLVDRLEKLGYAVRTAAVGDRRKVLVRITDKGRALVAAIREDVRENLCKIMKALTPDEQHKWIQIYQKIYDIILAQNCSVEQLP